MAVDWGLVGAVSGVLLAFGGLVLVMVLTSPQRRRQYARQLDDQTAQAFAERAERIRR